METTKKISFFECTIGLLALCYKIPLEAQGTENLSQKLGEVLENEIRVVELLTEFESSNDFSKIKALGLLFSIVEFSKHDPTVSSLFSFGTKYDLKNIELDLFEIYSHDKEPETETFFELSYGKAIIKNQRGLVDLLMERTQESVIANCKRIIDSWLANRYSLEQLHQRDYMFHARPVETTYLIYEAVR